MQVTRRHDHYVAAHDAQQPTSAVHRVSIPLLLLPRGSQHYGQACVPSVFRTPTFATCGMSA
jgi:hypothetical protein